MCIGIVRICYHLICTPLPPVNEQCLKYCCDNILEQISKFIHYKLLLLENDIDGDAFCLLKDESLKVMIKSQGLLLKFQKIYSQLMSDKASHSCAPEIAEVELDVVAPQIPVTKKNSSKPLSDNIIQEQSKIYGRNNKNHKLSKWQEAVNHAAYNLVKLSPDKMYDRAVLKTAAEEEARKSYVFQKKSGSRSKYVSDQKVNKRAHMSANEREEAIKLCTINLQSLTEQSENKRKQIAQANDLKSYEECAKLHKELRSLLNEKGKVEQQLNKLKKKVKRHLRYAAGACQSTKEDKCIVNVPKRDITSFFMLKDPGHSSPNTSTCTITSDDSNVSQDTLILSSDEYEYRHECEDERNRIKKRKLDFYKGCPELGENESLVGNEDESKAREDACFTSTNVVEIETENTTTPAGKECDNNVTDDIEVVDGAAKNNAISGEFQILEEGTAVAVNKEVEIMESKEKNVECEEPNSMVTAIETIGTGYADQVLECKRGKESNAEVMSLASGSEKNSDNFL